MSIADVIAGRIGHDGTVAESASLVKGSSLPLTNGMDQPRPGLAVVVYITLYLYRASPIVAMLPVDSRSDCA